MQVYTQATVNQTLPTGALWWPCVITESVPHSAAQQQPLLITHIAAMQHYAHDRSVLMDQLIICVGRHTAERLRDMGFTKIRCWLKAAEVRISQQVTWLRGEHIARDFSEDALVSQIQTYRSVLNHHNIEKLLQSEPHSIHVYSAQVLTALQTRSWPHTTLHTVPSAPADENLWQDVQQFDPNNALHTQPIN